MAIEQAKQKNQQKREAELRAEEALIANEKKLKMKHKAIYDATVKSKKMELLPVEMQPLSATKKEGVSDKAKTMNIVNYWVDLDQEQQSHIKSVLDKYRRPFKLLMKK